MFTSKAAKGETEVGLWSMC